MLKLINSLIKSVFISECLYGGVTYLNFAPMKSPKLTRSL